MENYPYVITISSEKGGVGKTTIATNLAIYLKALSEDLPVSIFSLDNHFTIDKMFAFKGQPVRGDVADLLLETRGSELLHTGQFGVNYIPSSSQLADLRNSIKGPMVLARLLAGSCISGILIVDTRPELDILTQNALYASDRVIIPVKDMPSLENCRNIFDLFDKRGLDKKSLSLIPCLVDARIKFNGPFRDQKTLLRAYATNRGYRCSDIFISKSPKVEGLNTNPEGRIYPILTHARGTEVYNQFSNLARQVLQEYRQTDTPRSLLFQNWLESEEERKKEAYESRLSRLKPDCLLCNHVLSGEQGVDVSYYYETSDGAAAGFLEEKCFTDFLLSAIYNLDKKMDADNQVRLMFQDSSRESFFILKTRNNGEEPAVEFSRYTLKGTLLARKLYPLREYEGRLLSREKSTLHVLVSETLGDYRGPIRDTFLLIHPVNPKNPHSILHEDNYKTFNRLMHNMAEGSG
jgi:cellulose biosynthesis protein BcsQ